MSDHPIDYSKLKKAPTPAHMTFKYAPIAVSAEHLAATTSVFADFVQRETDLAIERLAMSCMVPASRLEYVLELAQEGTITTEQARELLDAPPLSEQPTLSARLGHLKHGPGGSGLSGPCDADCAKCKVEASAKARAEYLATPLPAGAPPTDPLDVQYDGVPLRTLLQDDELSRREDRQAMARCRCNTPAQRAAVSAHRSAELRAKVAASAERDRSRVLVDLQDEP